MLLQIQGVSYFLNQQTIREACRLRATAVHCLTLFNLCLTQMFIHMVESWFLLVGYFADPIFWYNTYKKRIKYNTIL